MRAGLAIAALFISTAAFAQPSSSPGPYVIDVRGVMSGLPSSGVFHPALPVATLVPKRGFGFGAGAHVYLLRLGAARIGIGAEMARARGTAATTAPASTSTTTTTTSSTTTRSALNTSTAIDTATTVTLVAPQVSFNFGTRDGWSYLSAGYGTARIHGSASGELTGPLTGSATLVHDEGRASAINYGGGARWFIREHMAVGFDLRFHRVAAVGTQPGTRVFALSVGLSVR